MKNDSPMHLVSLLDWDGERIEKLLLLAHALKKDVAEGRLKPVLERKTLALIFEKSSLRSRVSMEVAMTQLGGASIYLSKNDINLGEREPIKDGARALSRYVDAIAARVFDHRTVEELASHSTIPVINALSDRFHPCQALADMMTIQEHFPPAADTPTVAYIGDANNVARSLAVICARLAVPFRIAAPVEYSFDPDFTEIVSEIAKRNGSAFECLTRPDEAAVGADVLYTDTWISMGQEDEIERRKQVFAPYRIDEKLQEIASQNHILMHCLPAYRGQEISDGAIEGPHSAVFKQAENRLHAQRALLRMVMKRSEKF